MAYSKMEKLRAYWCQKVIPLVYDESLSYYEFLCKLMKKINDVIEMINQMMDVLDDHEERLDVLEAWKTVMEIWKTTVQTQINNIIDGTTPITLPIATATRLGVVKIGSGITVQADGTISVEGGGSPYVLPTMSASTKGGARLGSGLKITDTDKLEFDGANADISENVSITNLEEDIDNIIDGTTEIDISENSSIETIEQNITNIIEGTTPVPSSYSLPTMSASTKGGAKLGSGLTVTDDVLAVDGSAIDISENTSITNIEEDIDNIIDGTTQIDISENTTIENIISGTTPVPSSYSLPTMSASTKGGAKVGSGLTIDNDVLNVDQTQIEKVSYDLSTITGIDDNLGSPEINYVYAIPRSQSIVHAQSVFKATGGTYYYCEVTSNAEDNLNIAVTFGKNSSGKLAIIIQNLGSTFSAIIKQINIDIWDNDGNQWFGRPIIWGDGSLSNINQGEVVCGVITSIEVIKYNLIKGSTFNFTSATKTVTGHLISESGTWDDRIYTAYPLITGQIAPRFAYTVQGVVLKSPWITMQENITNIQSTLSSRIASNVPQSTESSYPTVSEFNALLTALKNAGLMVSDS